MSNINFDCILDQFNINTQTSAYGNGHINDTYLTNTGNYILQRINNKVFTNPEQLMENIVRVTEFLKEKIIAEGGNPDREILTVIKANNGKNYFKFDDDHYFRVYKYITDTITIEKSEAPEDLYAAGEGFGHFQMLLADFPADTLHESIADFHHTPKRVEALKKAIAEDKSGRAASVQAEIEFALENSKYASVITDGIKDGSIPLRVTHNDTKINNILFDARTRKAVCVIDLDTVMPGSALYDFGDALRVGASTAAEDETDLSLVSFDTECFKSFAGGYFKEMKNSLTPREIELLPFSAKLLTYECGIRFLTDYLNGDTYFKIHREHHNLDRARNQFKLVKDIASKENELTQIIKEMNK